MPGSSYLQKVAASYGFTVRIWAGILLLVFAITAQPQQQSPDYTLGKPRIWSYQRVYPFLDGVFQDVASTMVSQLTLTPNGANASTLDAVQNAFQLGISYSPLTGAQNALGQQQNAVVTANAALQTQILTQQAQLTQQLVTATQLAGQANTAVSQLQAQTNPDPTALANAQQAAAVANNNVQTATAQLAVLKAEMPTTSLTQQTLSPPSQAQMASAGLPTQLTQLTAPSGAPAQPSFPDSKQMDNQVNILWERLSRLVGTLSKADSLTNYKLVLAGFSINLLPVHRKKEIFAVEYSVTGVAPQGKNCDSVDAHAIDLFPSASAVNIVNNQYKDNRFSLSALLGFGALAATAAFNREHLQISQSLGQSAYITGFGAGSPDFGWAFGRNLGDDSVSPGTRTVFAVLAVPNACEEVKIEPKKAGWFGETSKKWYLDHEARDFAIVADNKNSGTECVELTPGSQDKCALPAQSVVAITYTPVEFDPTVTTNNPATIQLKLKEPIDPQLTISIDGRIIQRARDTFGRAIPGAGSPGLLETNSYGMNTWIPISSKDLSIQLNPAQVERRFPEIMLSSPLAATSVSNWLPKIAISDPSRVTTISGEDFKCVDPCALNMPPLSYRKSSALALAIFHWDRGVEIKGTVKPALSAKTTATSSCNGTPANGSMEDTSQDDVCSDIFISVTSGAAASAQGQASVPGNATMQVINDAGSSPWGSNTVVTITTSDEKMYRLPCEPFDSRLHCTVIPYLRDVLHKPGTIEVHDPDHAGGPVSGWTGWAPSSTENKVAVWRYPQPKWIASQAGKNYDTLYLCIGAFNLNDGEGLTLMDPSSQTPIGKFNRLPVLDANNKVISSDCLGGSGIFDRKAVQFELRLTLEQYLSLTDRMSLVFSQHTDQPTTLGNLRSSAAPVVSVPSPDFLTYTGQNLVFTQLRVGDTGPIIPLTCDLTSTSCVANVPDRTKSLGADAGPLYFLDPAPNNREISVSQLVSGVPTNIPYKPPAATATNSPGVDKDKSGNNQGSFQFSVSGSASGSGSAAQLGSATPPSTTMTAPASSATPSISPSTGSPQVPAPTTAAPPIATPVKPQMVVIQ